MSVLLNVTAIELETRHESDLERDLNAVGAANLLSASLGGYVTCSSLSRTTALETGFPDLPLRPKSHYRLNGGCPCFPALLRSTPRPIQINP